MAYIHCLSITNLEINMSTFTFKSSEYSEVREAFRKAQEELTEAQKHELLRQRNVIRGAVSSLQNLYRVMNPLRDKLQKYKSSKAKVVLGILFFGLVAGFFSGSSVEVVLIMAALYIGFEYDVHRNEKSYQACWHSELVIFKDVNILGVSEQHVKKCANAWLSDSEDANKWDLLLDIEILNRVTGKWDIYYLED